MAGSATFTIEESRAFMNMPRHTTTKANHRRRLLRAADAVGDGEVGADMAGAPGGGVPAFGAEAIQSVPNSERGGQIRLSSHCPTADSTQVLVSVRAGPSPKTVVNDTAPAPAAAAPSRPAAVA